MSNKEMIFKEVREICMEHLKVGLGTREEEKTNEDTLAVTRTIYGKVTLFWDNQIIDESSEQVLSRIVESPQAGTAGISGASLY